jgi:amidase
MGHLRTPSAEAVRTAAARDFLHLTQEEAEQFVPFVAGTFAAFDAVEELPELVPPPRYGVRDSGRAPTPEEDPYNAFIRLCRIEGAPTGPLAGRTIAIKDNIAIAGLPQTNGSRTANFVPISDAAVVERVLEAGATIIGKTNLDDYSVSGYGESSYYGPPRNVHDPTRSAGGSSNGSAVAVSSGAADLAIGGDTGGSVRIPGAINGIVGMKGTHGLVAGTGGPPLDPTMDALGPLARTVDDTALLLEVIAGADWRDSQWVRGDVRVDEYRRAADDGIEGLRVGVIEESLDESMCDEAVLAGVERAADALREGGAHVERVSVPLYQPASAVWLATVIMNTAATIRTDGMGRAHTGYADVRRAHAWWLTRRQEAHLYPPLYKLMLIVDSLLDDMYGSTVYAKAQNQRIVFTRSLDEQLANYDVLLTPTTPRVAQPLATEPMNEFQQMGKTTTMTLLACQFNLSGHPALALPSGKDADGLPTSVQIVGPHWGERKVFRAAYALEPLLAGTPRRETIAGD